MKKILAVDLCNTIYQSNTTQDFFDFSFKSQKEYISFKKENNSFYFRVINKLSNKCLKKDLSKKLITKILKGKSKDEIDLLVKKFLDDFLENKKIIKVEELIKEYKEKGYYVVLISASYDFIAEAVAKKLGIDEIIASKATIVDNKFTGDVEEDILYNKFEKFQNEFQSYDDLIMITDNETDYDFVNNTKKSYIIIHNKNKDFWNRKKDERLIFIEE
ncbi:MAG: HAD family hydrolase [Sarcina sp.]